MAKKLEVSKDYKSKLESEPPRLLQYLINKQSEFVPNIIEVSRIIEPVLNRISITFPNYTLHDINHSIRIMEYMFDFMVNTDVFSDLEITILIYVALLHDIGMHVNEQERKAIKLDLYEGVDYKYSAILNKYKDEVDALQEFIRKIHARRSSEFVLNKLSKFLVIPSQQAISFSEDVARICECHTQNVIWLKDNLETQNEKGIYPYNSLFCGILLRLSDIMDIDSNRTPPFLFDLIRPEGISLEEWKQHFVINNRFKIKNDESLKRKSIVLYGTCKDPNIHRKILKYFKWINDEIKFAVATFGSFEGKYILDIVYPIKDEIKPIGYSISDLQLKLDFTAITELLMGEHIYGERNLGLRELIQNAIDACFVKKEILEKRGPLSRLENYKPQIIVILDEDNNKFIIKDNGTGMTLQTIERNFLNVGLSYYRSDDFLFKGFNYKPIGRFGIGFLSCFMLSDSVSVKTRNISEKFKYELQFRKNDEYIVLNKTEDFEFSGTEIILDYKQCIMLFGYDVKKVESFLKKHFLSSGIDIGLYIGNTTTKVENTFDVIEKDDKSYIIDFSEYLEEIEGSINFELKGTLFKEKINQLTEYRKPILLNRAKLTENDLKLKNIVYNNKIAYLDIRIIDSNSENYFNNADEIFEDPEEAITKMEGKLPELRVFLGDSVFKYVTDFYINDYIPYKVNKITAGLTTKKLLKYGHLEDYPVLVNATWRDVCFDEDNNLMILLNDYNNTEEDNYYDPINIFFGDVYLRNVLVKDYTLKPWVYFDTLNIDKIQLNIKNPEIITDVSRNNLEKQSDRLLRYSIYKVVHEFLYNNLKMNKIEKKLFAKFLNIYYSQSSVLLKKELKYPL